MRQISVLWLLFFTFYSSLTIGQTRDTITSHDIEQIIVTTYKDKPASKSSLNIEAIKMDSINKYGSYNLTQLLAKTPGVSILSTGIAISKPVIRGLYGNRILVLLAGLKFDNQQWQEEHGLGLSSIGLSEVELIKGPIGILYGTEAIGGIINLIDEEKPKVNGKEADFRINFNSNTLGGLIQGGYKENSGNQFWKLRLGIENNADYTDGNNNRVLNSRFDGYYLKSTLGFVRKSWTSTNNFSSSFNRFGFIFNDAYTFVKPDQRWSRSLNVNPAHLVLLNILSSENKFKIGERSKLNLNIGLQSNKRLENEGGGAISLNMHLFTIQNLLKYEYLVSDKNKLIVSNLNSFEDNTNFGARKIVPDAQMQESNLSAYLETNLKETLIFENGIGIGEKNIKTYFTAGVNGQGKEIQPFNKFSPYYNAFTGLTYFPSNAFNIKANCATGVRVANLAELSSNGLHEGVFTYEIGNPDLKNEQIVSFNLYSNYTSKFFDFSISPFYNYFYNYIYLSPTAQQWFGFPVYRYLQQNATQYGTEASCTFKWNTNLSLKISYSGMISKTQDKLYTPFIPAQKLAPTIFFKVNKQAPINIYTSLEYNFAQNKTAPYEIKTPNYTLWNMGISTNFLKNNKKITIAFTINNLLNTAYYDHLSRFKNFGLLNSGRNIVVNFSLINFK